MVKSAISISAYAKINLHLEVLGKRNDGFHNIVSVFHSISLCDELLIEKTAQKGVCKVLSPLEELPAQNTLITAYNEFAAASGITDGVIIRILKNIPIGAGLGGGSSDAAAVLRGLNNMFNTRLTETRLHSIALNIGSDVPFFLHGGAAVVTGRGEFIKPLPFCSGYFGVLVFPEKVVSTAEAYGLLNRSQSDMHSAFNPENYYGSDCRLWSFFNSFEEPVFKVFPAIKEAKDSLAVYESDFTLMSGSGSSVFGLFKDEKKAYRAYLKLLEQYKRCFLFFLLAL